MARVRKTHIRIISLHKWFPENDEFAARMARLCILREDFLFELEEYVGAISAPLEDEYGPTWRQLYFLRRMCVTLKEVRSACEDLSINEEFKRFLDIQPESFVKDWRRFKADLKRAMSMIQPVRDQVSAHIKQSSIEQALRQMCD